MVRSTPAAGSTARQEVAIDAKHLRDPEIPREIVKKIKDSKIKVQASIQGDLVRVSGKSRDLLQEAMQVLKRSDSAGTTVYELSDILRRAAERHISLKSIFEYLCAFLWLFSYFSIPYAFIFRYR